MLKGGNKIARASFCNPLDGRSRVQEARGLEFGFYWLAHLEDCF